MRLLLHFFGWFLVSCRPSFQVTNKGIAGNNSFDLLKRVDTAVVAEKADLVILLVGTNDMMNSSKLVSMDQFKENYALLLKKIRTSGASIVVMSIPPVDTGYIFTRHPREAYDTDPNEKIRLANRQLEILVKDSFNQYFFDLHAFFVKHGS